MNIQEKIEKLNRLSQRLTDEENIRFLQEVAWQIERDDEYMDKIMKFNMWVTERFLPQIEQEMGLNDDDEDSIRFLKANRLFEKIIKEENEKYPLKWYEYGLLGK